VQPNDRQPAGRDAKGVGDRVEEVVVDVLTLELDLEVVVVVIVELDLAAVVVVVVVLGLVTDGVVTVGLGLEVVVLVDDEAEDEDEVVGVMARKMLILFAPPHATPISPVHLESQPLVAGTTLAVFPHQHSCPYSTPA
jgi:hypothetical protein